MLSIFVELCDSLLRVFFYALSCLLSCLVGPVRHEITSLGIRVPVALLSVGLYHACCPSWFVYLFVWLYYVTKLFYAISSIKPSRLYSL